MCVAPTAPGGVFPKSRVAHTILLREITIEQPQQVRRRPLPWEDIDPCRKRCLCKRPQCQHRRRHTPHPPRACSVVTPRWRSCSPADREGGDAVNDKAKCPPNKPALPEPSQAIHGLAHEPWLSGSESSTPWAEHSGSHQSVVPMHAYTPRQHMSCT